MTEPTTRAAAEAAKVSEATIWRWLADPIFASTYREARGRLLEGTLTALQSASVDAVACLREVINDKSAQVPARVSAAKAVLELSLKAREVLKVEERMAYLEKCLEIKDGRSNAI